MIRSRWRPRRASRLANTRLHVRPFHHGIEPGGSRPGSQVPVWALSMKPSLFGARSGGQSRLDVTFVAQRKLRAVPDPPCLGVGTGMNVWVVGRIVGPPLRPGLAARPYGCRGGASVASMITASARDPRSDGKPRPGDHRGLRKRQRAVASGTGAKRSGPQHSMKSSHS